MPDCNNNTSQAAIVYLVIIYIMTIIFSKRDVDVPI